MNLDHREVHGATPMAGSAKSPLIVLETDETIIVREGYSDKLVLKAPAARFLARKLNRLALRIEKRAAQVGDARRAETGTGSVHEHAVAEGDAPNSDRTTP